MRKLFTLLIVLFLWAGSSWGQLNESFSGTVFPPSDWIAFRGTNGLGTVQDWVRYTTNPYSAPACASVNYENVSEGLAEDWLVTPKVSVSEGNNTLTFWIRDQFSSNYGSVLSIRASSTSQNNHGDFTTIVDFTEPGTTYVQKTVDLSSYNNQNIHIAFVWINDDGDRLYLDDVLGPPIYAAPDPPNCATLVSPADAAANVPVGATLNWASGGGAPTGYKLYFGTDNPPTNIVNGTNLGNVTTYDPTPDMSYSTIYYWQVVPTNDNGDATGCAVWSFTTGPDPTVTVFPFTEGFEGATFPPYGWSQITVSGTSPWIMSTTSPHSGLQCARAPWASAGGEHLLITPPLDLTTVDYRLKFWLKGSSSAGTDLEVQISTNNSSASNFTTTLATYIAGTNMPTVWTEQIIDLSAYEDIQYIAFRLIDDDGYAFYIDDVTIEEIPATPVFEITPLSKDYGNLIVGTVSAAQVFTISNSGGSTLTISNGGISLTGTNQGEFTLTDANSYPISLASGQSVTVSVDFAPNTVGSKSANLQVVHNATGSPSTVALTGYALPVGTLFESFEATTFPPAGWANPGTWSRSTSYSYEGVASAYKFTTATANLLRTPLVAINNSSTLNFYARTSTTSIYQRIQVQYSDDGTTWTNIGTEIELPSAGAFALYTIDLSSIPAGDYYLAFSTYYATGGSGGSVYIDYITGPVTASVVPDAVTLVAPADAATNVSITPSLSWTPAATGGVPTGYKIYLDENTDPTTLLTTVTASPYVVATPLDYSTTYYWKVVATNATGDGEASVVRSFTTLADPTLTPPFTQTFDTYPPLNWTETSGLLADPSVLTGTSSAWTADGFANVGTTGSARLEIWSTGLYAWMVTPPIDLGDGSTDYELRFDLALTFWNSTGPANTTGVDDKFAVVISTDNGQTWSSANTLRLWDNAGSPYVYNNISNTGETIILDLSAYSGVIKIGFYGESTISNADNNVYVDNLIVQEPPTCEMPLSVNVPTYTLNSATITWTAAIPAPANGYEWQVLDASLAVVASGATAAGVTTANATGLAANTSYTAVVRSVCAVNDYSAWTSPVPFYTGYCIPAPTSVDGQGITNVTFSTVNNTTGAETGNYGDYSAQIGDVNRDATVPVAITFQTGYTYDTKIWIDWNDDLDFSDAGEEVYSGTSLATNPTTLAASFIVPSDAPLGNHRMRIGGVDTGPPTPCYTGSYGSYEDYTVNVLEALPTEMVRGEVTDCYTGAFLEGVSVSIAALTTTTDVNGYYEFPEVNIGTYDLSASLSGYFSKTITGVVVAEGATTTQDICLNIYVDPPLNLQASVENQDVHLTWNAPGVVPESFTDGFESYTDFSLSFPPWLNTDLDLSSTYSITDITFTNQGYTGAFITFNPSTTVPALTDAAWLAHSGSKYAACFSATTPPNNDWLISPQVAIVTGSQLKFWAKSVTDLYGLERFRVGISATGTATTDFTIISTEPYVEAPLDWTEYTFDLSAYVGQNIYVAINCVSSDAFVLMIDDFSIGVPGKNAEPIIANRPSGQQLVNLQPPTRSIVKGSNIISEKANVALIDNTTENNRAPMATLTGYNIYKDEAFLAFTTLTEYDDLTLPAGTYSYTVTAVYSEGESEPAGPVTVEIITCNVPTNLQVTEFDQTTATIGWTAPDPAPANGYEYEVRTDGDPGSGATGLAASGTTAAGVTTANITGLEDGTIYMVYVRSVCGTDNYSNWTGGVQFVTTCLERNLPFAEDFEESSANRNCWTIYNIDLAGTSWGLSSAYNHTEGGVLSAVHAYGPSTNTEDGYLVSPGLIIPASGYIELSFWSYNSFPSFYDKNSVMISAGSPDPTDGDYVEIWSPASVTASWAQTLLDLSAYHGQTIYIAFRYQGSDAHNWYVDDVSVSVQTPPTKTLNLTDVRLEHLFVTGTGGMMNQAYNASGPQFTAPTADVITVELHDAATYANVLRTYTGVALSQTGTASVTDIDLPDGSYRITIRHRNSVETTSMLPVDFTGAIVSYSFGTQASAYGNNLKLIDGFYCIFGGDVNQDGQVEGLDVTDIENGVNSFATGYLSIDVDGDGSLGISDYSIWENNNNNFVKRIIPNP